ncbi:origin recognition complex subunit 1 [Kwoniella heveanensis CBS 569]|nr:origin recognition complex subunit 1 [Kwoniella heveanensis CBS 569]
MAISTPTPVTPRRSTRGTIFTPSPSVSSYGGGPSTSTQARKADTSYHWNSAPLANPTSNSNSSSGIPGQSSQTQVRYNSFSRIVSRKISTPLRIGLAGKTASAGASRAKGDEESRFTVGDGVLVSVEGGDEGVGIIIGLWEEQPQHTDGLDDDDDEPQEEQEEGPRMMAEIHWAFRKEDLPSIMKTANVQENEVLLAASTTSRPVTSILPVQLLSRTIPIYSKAFYREQFPETKSKVKGWSYVRQGVYWCHRAFDKFARGGKSWKVDIDEWREGGKRGLGWTVKENAADDGVGAAAGKDEESGSDFNEDEGSEVEVEDDGDEDDEGEGEDEDEDEEEEEEDDGEEGDTFKPNQRKRKRPTTKSAPGKKKKKQPSKKTKLPTKRKLAALPGGGKIAAAQGRGRLKKVPHPKSSASHLPLSVLSPEELPVDPYERALRLLHVGATPESLPCREEEFVDVLSKVEEGVESGGGGCLYIAGVPGTGKTATVHAVVKELKRKAEDGELPPFSYVEINGLKIPSPQHAYTVLWEAISGAKGASAKTALRGLEGHFGRKVGRGVRGPRGHTFVVLMDELDQLLTAKQDVVYNFFNWPTMPDSQIFVIAVANRMDLPQHLAAKIKSRIGLQTILFQPYDRTALISIVQSRLIPHPLAPSGDPKVLLPDAIALAATKMAGTNGDARRVLDACRRAVEVALEGKGNKSAVPSTNGSDNPQKGIANLSSTTATGVHANLPQRQRQPHPQPHPVTAKEMMAVLQAMSASPVSKFIASCSIHQKMMLAALVRCIRREGIPEISWRSLRNDHDALCRSLLFDLTMSESSDIGGGGGAEEVLLSTSELALVFSSLLASHALVSTDLRHRHLVRTSAATEGGEGGGGDDRKVALGLEVGEVGRVLMAEGESWRRALAGV